MDVPEVISRSLCTYDLKSKNPAKVILWQGLHKGSTHFRK
jgi:hypothetical protein